MNKKDCILEKKDYVIKEYPDGKKVTVRQLQLEILEMMDELHRVCEKNNIKYALMAGSALGICNYKGFIPWDDDIDVCIKKEDYPRFLEALKKDLSDKYYFHCFDTDKRYNVLIPPFKIRKKGTYLQETNYLLENRCPGDGVFIDVVIYDNMSDSKFKEELYRTPIKLLMPILVVLDNLGFKAVALKKLVLKIADKYGKKFKNDKYTSQTIAIPWEKFLKEPVFLKEDVYPFKLYEFEGRQFYSYNNIEKIMKEWYGPNCLKKWDGKKWVETLPVEKRVPKHVVDINLESEERTVNLKKVGSRFIKGITIGLFLIILALIIFNECSFIIAGIGIMTIGISIKIFLDKQI